MFLHTILKYFAKRPVLTFIESDRLTTQRIYWVTNTTNLHISGTNGDKDFKFEAYYREK